MNWYDPTPQRYSMPKCSRRPCAASVHAWGVGKAQGGRADGVCAGAGGHHLRQRARQELVGCIEMGCIEICSSKVAPDRTPTSTAWDVLKWDVLKSVGRKYEKGKLCVSVLRTVKSRRGKLVKYKAINELVRVGAITPMNWYAITPMNWYAWGRSRVGAIKLAKYKSACLCTIQHLSATRCRRGGRADGVRAGAGGHYQGH